MDVDLRRIVSDNFGFGDFIFRNPDTGEEIARVRNLKELQTFFCRACGVLLISYQPESRIALVLFSCHVPGSRVLETDYLE